MQENIRIAVIGPGVMGKTIVSSLIVSGHADPSRLIFAGPNPERLAQLRDELGVEGTTDNGAAAQSADVIILAIKPQRLDVVARSIRESLGHAKLVISILAGVTTASLVNKLGFPRIIRAMPNTPAQIGMGMTVWTKTPQVDEPMMALAARIFQTLGQEIYVEDEDYLDMATALSGTGPAYVFLFMEAMIDAGVHMGLPRRMAERMVSTTIQGSVGFYERNQEHPARLRNQVTSPGGTSAEALYYLEKAGFRTAVSRAIWAAYQRSKELGAGKTKESIGGDPA